MTGATPTFDFSTPGAGTYTVELTVTDDNPTASSTVSKQITVNSCCTAIQVTTDPQSHSACKSASTQFTAAASGTPTPTAQWQVYDDENNTWIDLTTGGVYSGVSTTELTISDVTGLDGKQYRAIFSSGSCTSVSTNSATLTVNNPTAYAGAALDPVCQGTSTAQLGGSFGGGATSAVWSDGGAGGSFTNNTGSTPGTATYTPSSTAGSSITLTLTTSGGSCGTVSDSKTLTVNPTPTANAGTTPDAQCYLSGGNTFTLNGSVTNATAHWDVAPGGNANNLHVDFGDASSAATSVTITGGSGEVILRLTAESDQDPGCGTDFKDVKVVVKSLPTAAAGTDFTKTCALNKDGAQIGEAAADGYTYSWSPATGLSNAAISNPIANPSETTTYTVTKTHTETGCSASDDVTATVNKTTPSISNIKGSVFCKEALSTSGTVTVSTSQTGVNYQLYDDINKNNIQVFQPGTGNTLIWSGLTVGTYHVIATNEASGCTFNSSTVQVQTGDCAYTFTNGFYGNQGGLACDGSSSLKIMEQALGMSSPGTNKASGGTNQLFGYNTQSFTLKPTDLTSGAIYKMLPGGSTPAAIQPVPTSGTTKNSCLNTNKGTATYDCTDSWKYVPLTGNGSIGNNLLSQTMALFFNMQYNKNVNSGKDKLGQIILNGPTLRFTALPCNASNSGNTSPDVNIDCSIYNYLKGMTGGATIRNLYVLSNLVLGGQVKTISPSSLNYAITAINNGLDKGGVMTSGGSCTQSLITQTNKVTVQGNALPERQIAAIAVPNPYTDRIHFTLTSPVTGQGSLEVFNLLGQKVATVFQGFVEAGKTQTVEYTVPEAHRSNLIYQFRVGDQRIAGKLLH